MADAVSLNKADQQIIAAREIYRLRKLHPGSKIDVFVGDNLDANGQPWFTVEIDGVSQPRA